jgi:CHAT domain-containing protein
MMVLKIGSRGSQVAEVQMRLKELEYPIAQVDGIFGPGTQDAVIFFQNQHGLEENGELTENQIEMLFSKNAQKASPVARADAPIGAAEMKSMMGYAAMAVKETDEKKRRRILSNAILEFGFRFLYVIDKIHRQTPEDMKELTALLQDQLSDVFASWLGGEQLTDRADEDERRAAAAMDALEAGGLGLIRLAAEAILRLPVDHPLRNMDFLRTKLLARAQECRDTELWEDFVLIGKILLRQDILTEPEAQVLVEDLTRLAESPTEEQQRVLDDESRRSIFLGIAGWHITRSIKDRDAGSNEAGAHRAASQEFMKKAQAIRSAPKDVLLLATALDESDQSEEAADLLSPLVDSGEDGYETAAWLEGLIRIRLGHYERGVEILERVVPQEEDLYLLAIGDENVESAGQRYSKDAVRLAFGYAFLGKWAKAIDTIDRVKSPRLRHAMKLRQSAAGSELLKLEAQLASASRGVPSSDVAGIDKETDPLGSRLSAVARVLEKYRESRPDLSTTRLGPPTLSEVGSALDKDEALVCMGSSFKGLMMGVLLHGDTDSPSGRFIFEELPKKRITKLMFESEQISGWALELAATEPVNPEPALDLFLTKTDNAFGKRLAEFLEKYGICKVTIIPHRMLHFIPFWALPSLKKFDVRTAPSMAQWYQNHKTVARLNEKATAVGNPTLDLGLATAEAEFLKAILEKRGCKTDVLVENDAKEDAIRDSIRGSGLLHFAGHGLAKPMQPMLSALLTHPEEKWGWPAEGDPLSALAKEAKKWTVNSDGTRHADLTEGRLVEYTDDKEEIVERRLEHAATGTLWGVYDQNQLLNLAELWTTSDVLIEDAFTTCSVAFLGACESGRGALRVEIDEDVGLPSALQLAGVDTVVCTLWPVGDVTALVFARIFYHHLTSQPRGTVNLAALVSTSRVELAGIDRDGTIGLLHEIAQQTTRKGTRAQLDYVIEKMAADPERPFAHPYHWAAFFTQGSELVEITWD